MAIIPFLFRLLSWLPLGALHALGAALGAAAFVLAPRLRRRIDSHLPAHLPERNRVLRAALRHAGMQVLELAWVWTRPASDLLARVDTANPAVLDDILARDQAVLMLTPHLGCFELIAQSYMATPHGRRRPMLALYREPRKEALRPLFSEARARGGLRLAPADLRGVRLMIRAMRHREVVGLLPDQVPSQGDGVWAPFFGRQAYTMTLPARLARDNHAAVLFVVAQRDARRGRFTIHWEPFDGELTGDPTQDATALNRCLENIILRCPEQYLWSYNRYKAPRGAPPRPADEGTP